MAYTKQTWENLPSQTTPINADRLTHIEDGIFNAAATADTAASNASSAISGLADKVDKVDGKGLSTNDFTDALKTKLDGIATGAEVNVQADYAQTNTEADDYIKNKPTLGTSAYKNSTSVVTESTDLVESGAVKDIVGFGNKNKADFIGAGYYDTNTGVFTPATLTNYGSFDKVKCEPNSEWTFSTENTINQVIWYEWASDGSFIRSTAHNISDTEDTFTVGSTTAYVALTARIASGYVTDVTSYGYAQLEKGSTATAYEPHHSSVEQTLRDAEVVQGKNFLPPSTSSGIFTVNNDGSITIDTGGSPVGANTDFLLFASNLPLNNGNWIINFNSNSTAIQYRYLETSSSATVTKNVSEESTITITNGKFYYLYLRVPSGTTVNNVTVYPMISKDGGAYEPYYIPLKDVVPTKADNSVIGTVEDRTNPTRTYAVGEHFIRNGKFCTVTVAVTTSSTWTLGSNYVEGTIADNLIKQDTFSGTTASNGNLLLLDNVSRHIIGFNAMGSIFIPFQTSTQIYLKVTDYNLAPKANTSVSGTYYYI